MRSLLTIAKSVCAPSITSAAHGTGGSFRIRPNSVNVSTVTRTQDTVI